MKKLMVIAVAAAGGMLGSVIAAPTAVAVPIRASASPTIDSIAWSPCSETEMRGALKGLECGSLEVPLDHSQPQGQQITLALTRAKHTAPDDQFQGIALLNRGQWPGPIGRDLPARFAKGTNGLPTSVGSTYDWIGFDPRGVGVSEPMLICDATYSYPGHARPDYVPRSAAEEDAWLTAARGYADSCGDLYGDALKHLNTIETALDMDLIRQALGHQKMSYYGYDYGTYLGAVYASMFPNRIQRMVLDSVVQPSRAWYGVSLDQNVAFEKGARIFFAWIARYDAVYHLGDTADKVEANYYKGMEMVRQAPIDGKIGLAEYTDIFVVDVYRNIAWTYHAQVLADWVLRNDAAGLRANFREPERNGMNSYSMYSAVQCRDAYWPLNWDRWRQDHTRQYRHGNTFMTWHNAWYNAPCKFWPVPAGKPQNVGAHGVNVLLVQGQDNAATPVAGAYEMHKLFPNSRLVLERDGIFHGTSLTPNANMCINNYVIAYLADGTRPASRTGADAFCDANPAPVPAAATLDATFVPALS